MVRACTTSMAGSAAHNRVCRAAVRAGSLATLAVTQRNSRTGSYGLMAKRKTFQGRPAAWACRRAIKTRLSQWSKTSSRWDGQEVSLVGHAEMAAGVPEAFGMQRPQATKWP